MFILLIISWLLSLFSLFVFSYTQIDLNLTFLNWEPYLKLQQSLINLGYFQRQTNMWFFILTLISMIILYVLTIYLVYKNKITFKQLGVIILGVSFISFLSYNAFSRDIFNYMFYGKIITIYGQNPYLHRPLDFPQDEWIRFMHWVHVTYPYGPVLLGMFIVPSFFGFGKFLVTYFLFKLLFVLSYLIICVYIYKTVQSIDIAIKYKSASLLAVASFALNPLVLINGLNSPHVDIIMAAFSVVSIYYLLSQKIIKSVVFLVLSIGVKFATFIYLPIFNSYAVKILGYKYWFICLFLLSFFGSVILQSYGRGLQIWYFILPLSILPFLVYSIKLKWLIFLNLIPNLYFYSYIIFILTGQW